MNCKKGDLAMIVRSTYPDNLGKIVMCIRRSERVPDAWITDNHNLIAWNGSRTRTVQDSYLRPIRPSDGEDEMLRIAGKPEKKNAIA